MAPAEDDVGEMEEVHIEEETEPMRMAPDPGQPTARQVEDHRRSHLPYRLWCKWCILGRGRGLQHRKSAGSSIPIIGLDYFFITSGGVKKRGELIYEASPDGEKELEDARAKGEIVKRLIVRCSASKTVLEFVVPRKGSDEDDFVADLVAQAVAWLGHTRIIVKADGEPAIQALVKRVLELVKVECKDLDQAAKEDPAAYDSQSNGGTEQGIRLIRGLFRTVKLCLEERINKFIPIDRPIIHWMMEHVCLLLNVMVRGDDGLTSWARVRGRAFHQQLVGFAERVLYKFPGKGPRHAPYGNMGATGGEGVFLGYNRQSNTFIVATESGIVMARSITRRPERERWQAEALARVRETPGALKARAERPRVRFEQPASEQGPTAEGVRPAQIRRLRINKTDLDQYGYDDACAQCKNIMRYGKAKPGGVHSDHCRAKIIEAMRQTEAGRARLAEQEDRETKAMAEQIEHADHRAREGAAGAPAEGPQPAPRGFLERTEDGRSAGVRPPPEARVGVHREEAPRAAERRDEATSQEEMGAPAGWLPVPGGEAAPVTPRGTPPVVDDSGGMEVPPESEAAVPEAGDAPMDGSGQGGGQGEGYDVEMDFIGGLEVQDDLGSIEPSVDDFVSGLLLQQLGSLGRSYKREARKSARAIVSEIYSPPRVTKLLRESRSRRVMPGFAFDITVMDPLDGRPWDFSIESKRRRARQLIREQNPYVLIGSPMCTHFCTWQALNYAKSEDKDRMDRARTAAEVHINFVASLYEEQMDAGKYFLHEHPMWATSWAMPRMRAVLERAEVQRV